MHLDAILADEPLAGGLEPRLGRAHLRTLTVLGFPSRTWPGLLDDLNRLAFPYRWCVRAVALDKTDATKVLTRIRRQWFAKRKSIAAIVKEVMTNESSVLMDSDAANKAADADLALQELGSDLIGEMYVTATVTVWDEDARAADERLRIVEKTIQGRDFSCIREGVNAIEAWLGSLPGHLYAPASTSASDQALVQGAQQRWQQSVQALQDSMRTQATVVGNLPNTTSQMQSLVTASQGATGALQATQAGNQLLGMLGQQLADLTSTMAAQGRAANLESAQRQAAASQGQEQLRRFLQTPTGYQPTTVTMFHN